MINFFLKIKNWQLFFLLLGLPLIFQFYTMFTFFSDFEADSNSNSEDILNYFDLFPIIMIVFTGLFFGWFWSIVMGLKKQIPFELQIQVGRFKLFFFFPLIYILLFLIYMTDFFNGFDNTNGSEIIGVILPLHLFSMFCIFHTMYFVAKTIKTVELKRKVGFGDFAGEFFLLWFYFIGIWMIQPKVNKLSKK